MPTSSMRVDFTAPIARDIAEAIRLKPVKGKPRLPKIDPNVKTVDAVTFEGPFPEQAQYTVELPANLHDDAGRTLASASTQTLDGVSGSKSDLATAVGREVARRALEAGVERVVFDRGGYLYHGRVKALADGARAGGLEF